MQMCRLYGMMFGFFAVSLVVAGARGQNGPSLETRVELELVWSGLNQPVGLAHAGDGSGRLFVVERTGRIRVFGGGSQAGTHLLDISRRETM